MGTVKDKTLLIDGDILIWRFACRNETRIQWAADVLTRDVDSEKAIRELEAFIHTLLQKTWCVKYKICFTSKFNFRYKVLSTYKHNRQGKELPALYKILKDYLKDNHPWESRRWLEADDLMGIYGSSDPDRYVLATIDKDFECIPCTLFNWNKDKKPRRISEEEADYHFYMQWLTGDSTDGYKGCPGIGPKKAAKILEAPREDWLEGVLAAYASKCVSYRDILKQARMARILRASDYNWKTGEAILWAPI